MLLSLCIIVLQRSAQFQDVVDSLLNFGGKLTLGYIITPDVMIWTSGQRLPEELTERMTIRHGEVRLLETNLAAD